MNYRKVKKVSKEESNKTLRKFILCYGALIIVYFTVLYGLATYFLTDKIIELINDKAEHVVFMMWGAYAQKKGRVIDRQKHLVLEAPHPSPLSAHRGFLGCRHFSKANSYLKQQGLLEINWQLMAESES